MNNKKKRIAFIYEGERTERTLINKMVEIYFSDSAEAAIISFAAGENIYMVWNRLKSYDFNAELIDVLKETSTSAKNQLKGLTARDFSEIYLFFDYDAHNNNLPDEYKNQDILMQLLEVFNNETEFGKLYISYPMIESLREIDIFTEDYHTYLVPIKGINYKRYVGNLAPASNTPPFQDFRKIERIKWEIACRASAKRANRIVNDNNAATTYPLFIDTLGQTNIYKAQLQKFVKPLNEISVLNSVPLFLLEYFDSRFWEQVMNPPSLDPKNI